MKFLRFHLPIVFYVCAIFTLSSINVGSAVNALPFPDKLYHVIEFLLLPVLWFRWFIFAGGRRSQRHYFMLGVAASVLIAACDEWYQSRVPNRTMDINDFAADCMGITLSVIVWYVWRRKRTVS